MDVCLSQVHRITLTNVQNFHHRLKKLVVKQTFKDHLFSIYEIRD